MDREAIETIQYRDHQIEIFPDGNCESPRDWDNICVFHIAHRRYDFGDENYDNRESIDKAERQAIANGDIVLPLYMYDHSGITVSLSPFSCPWDSGQVGFVAVPRKKMIEEFGKKRFTPALKKRALKIAQGEVEDFDKYCTGDVYGYVIDGDGDSCYGYYGMEYAIEEAKSVVDYIVDQERKEYCEKVEKERTL